MDGVNAQARAVNRPGAFPSKNNDQVPALYSTTSSSWTVPTPGTTVAAVLNDT